MASAPIPPQRISRVTAIVLHYRGLPDTLACLESLRHQDEARARVLVIDNASPEGPAEAIRAAHPDVELISTPSNLGYAGGNNVGIRAALQEGADAIFLVNNDTRIEPSCMTSLVDALEARPQIGLLGPMVYTCDAGRVISSAGGAIDWSHADSANVGAGEIDHGQYPARPVDFVNGCGLMITRAAIERAGLLDERYFMYWEETDWCVRVRRAGFEVRFEPAARMRHKAPIRSEQLGPTTLYYLTRNRLRFFARHAPLRVKPLALAHAVHGAWREVARHRRSGRAAQAEAMWLGIIHGLIGRRGRVDWTVAA